MRKRFREIVSKFQLSFDRSFSGLVKYQLLWMCLFIFIALLFLFILFFPGYKEQSFSQIVSSLFVDMISPVVQHSKHLLRLHTQSLSVQGKSRQE